MTVKEKLSARFTRREFIKPISAGVFGFPFLNLFKAPLAAQTKNTEEELAAFSDLPPIIIKSGSFIIQTAEPLVESGSNPYNYKRSGFNLIQRVQVIKINEITGMAAVFPFEDSTGIELDIRLQHYNSGNWQPIAQSPLAQVTNEILQGSTNFVLKIPKKLERKPNPKPGKKEKREDKGNDIFRFGSLVIRGKGTVPPPVIPPTEDGDEYIIGLYNTLATKNLKSSST